jgi:hypothetical protein
MPVTAQLSFESSTHRARAVANAPLDASDNDPHHASNGGCAAGGNPDGALLIAIAALMLLTGFRGPRRA